MLKSETGTDADFTDDDSQLSGHVVSRVGVIDEIIQRRGGGVGTAVGRDALFGMQIPQSGIYIGFFRPMIRKATGKQFRITNGYKQITLVIRD